MFQVKAKVIKNIAVTKNYCKIVLSCAQIAKAAEPGQFVNVKITDGCEPLLRRPFGIHRVKGANIELLFEVLGPGTKILSQKKAGEYLDIIGPLGNGFDYALSAKRYPLIIAGGMGVAPFLFLAEILAYSVERRVFGENKKFKLSAKRCPLNAKVLIGAKTKSQVLCEKEFKALGCDVKIATDDGSKGFKGKVTELLINELYALRSTLSAIYACGPRPMLKEIAAISKRHNIPAQISLEAHLACGLGACLGCVVKTRGEGRGARGEFEYKRVCKEGPVFKAEQIIWE